MTPPQPASGERRNHTMDFVRLLFAMLVLLAHAFELQDGNNTRELLHRLTNDALSLGELAVDGFFLLSGFLIAKSWDHDPRLGHFLWKRVLRIVPGYLVAALLSILVVGALAPADSHFFAGLDRSTVTSLLMLGSPHTPPVLPGNPYPEVNGSMWTIAYEFRCYLLVALLGLCGLLNRRVFTLVLTAVAYLPFTVAFFANHLVWHRGLSLFGDPDRTLRLTPIYLVGVCFYLFRDHIPFRPALAVLAFALLLAVGVWKPGHLENALGLCGAYLLFFLMQSKPAIAGFMRHFPDISYGVYLYGWPVESLWIWFRHGNPRHGTPWITFAVSVVITSALGWLSWHLVERRCLKLKKVFPRTTLLREAIGAVR